MLKNKTAIITGSNRGIGFAILKKMSENGANIIACSRKKDENFEKKLEEVSKKNKNQIKPIYFDLLDEKEIERAVKEIVDLNLNIEILVNNAGVNHVSLFQMTSIQKIKEIFQVNFFSQAQFTQKIIKMMIKNKKGSIINLSSNAVVECDAGRSAYASSKAALIAFTKVLSKELGAFNIRTNSIAPGLTKTEMMEKDISKKIIDEAINKIPFKRPADPEEISNVAVFLASDLSTYINGEVIFVTGGY